MKKNQSSARLNRQYEAVNDMFRPKKAYETPSERLQLKTLSVLFNVLSAALFSSFAISFKLPFGEKVAACAAWLVLAVVVELAKRNYGRKYKSQELAHDDERLDEGTQQMFLDNSRKNMVKFAGFVIFSVVVACWSGSRNAYIFAVESVEQLEHLNQQYDTSIKDAVTMARQNHQAALKSDRDDIASHKRALAAYNRAVEKWDNHKAEIDEQNRVAKKTVENQNAGLKNEGHNDGLKYALIAGLLSLIVEFFSIFYLFEYVESCYEVLRSFEENAEIVTERGKQKTVNIKTATDEPTIKIVQSDTTLTEEEEERLLYLKLAELQKRKK